MSELGENKNRRKKKIYRIHNERQILQHVHFKNIFSLLTLSSNRLDTMNEILFILINVVLT